ncbi:MAG: winged helix-turn-helix transcriptional regulator [Ruminococcaceae bacterium]|nr:winged helix-turn-helix transcriptional regulator [Oscillospiraceae bacterium]
MSVAIFSQDATLARMLLLEARRCGLQEVPPAQARVWLLDLDHLPTLPREGGALLQIGFSAHPEEVKNSTRSGLYAILELPFSARELDAILQQRELLPAARLLREGGELWLAGKKLHFSKIENRILSLLYENRHRTVAVAEIEAVLGENAKKSNAAAVYLYRLRRKLETDGIARIRTRRGAGYQWIGE